MPLRLTLAALHILVSACASRGPYHEAAHGIDHSLSGATARRSFVAQYALESGRQPFDQTSLQASRGLNRYVSLCCQIATRVPAAAVDHAAETRLVACMQEAGWEREFIEAPSKVHNTRSTGPRGQPALKSIPSGPRPVNSVVRFRSMSYVQVRFWGRGIRVPCEDGSDPIVGFYTTRRVWARSKTEAEQKAQALVLADWTSGPYAASNQGQVPALQLEDAFHIGWLRGLLTKRPAGYSFYRYESTDT
jgi:hypothetical protein